MLLEGKNILIAGGVSGIGRAVAVVCAREGASVVAVSRDRTADQRAQALILACSRAGFGKFGHVSADFDSRDSVCRAVARAAEILGGIDCVVNCAAPAERALSIASGMRLVNETAFRHLKAHGGTILNISDAEPAGGAIAAHSRKLAQEWGCYRIRVHALLSAAESNPDSNRQIGDLAAFLASDRAALLTGQTIAVGTAPTRRSLSSCLPAAAAI